MAEIDCDAFILVFSAQVATVRARVQVRLLPPQGGVISATVAVETEGEAPLETCRPWDMCKPVMLSSMWKEPDRWDAQVARIGKQSIPIPPEAWFIQPPAVATRFGLQGGHSRWQAQRKVGPSPNVTITLAEALPVTGWVTPGKTVRDDNVAVWAACDRLPRAWSYRIDADLEDDPPSAHPFSITLSHDQK
jgi:hypothetical protein